MTKIAKQNVKKRKTANIVCRIKFPLERKNVPCKPGSRAQTSQKIHQKNKNLTGDYTLARKMLKIITQMNKYKRKSENNATSAVLPSNECENIHVGHLSGDDEQFLLKNTIFLGQDTLYVHLHQTKVWPGFRSIFFKHVFNQPKR